MTFSVPVLGEVMEEFSSIMNSVAILFVIVAGGVSVIAFCYAGLLWMTASGDPGKMGQARSALIGAIGGLVIVGIAFIVPRIINEVVIEPVGGVSLQTDSSLDCDTVMRRQFVFQRAASTAEKMNAVVAQIQSQREECASDVWDPRVDDDGYRDVAAGVGVDPDPAIDGCFGVVGADTDAENAYWAGDIRVGSTSVPRGLKLQNDENLAVRENSGRDADNNIIVYWGAPGSRPTDDAVCWLYVSRLRTWDESY